MPLVSVIIPNYNHAKFLVQRIESILNQTYSDFEVIILDDCSSDNSKSIIEKYRGHPKISNIIYNTINSGSTFKQWKTGIALSKGKYIWIAESDDFADTKFLETVLEPFFKNSNIVLSYCQSMIVNEKSQNIHIANWADPLNDSKWKVDYVEDSYVEKVNYLRYRNTIPNASAVVFSRPDDTDILSDSCRMRFSGDWLFWRKLLKKNTKIAYTSNILNYFRVHDKTTRTVTTTDKEITRFKEFVSFIDTSYYNIFESRYDWILIEWLEKREFLITRNFYFPNFPFFLRIRFYYIGLSKLFKKLFK